MSESFQFFGIPLPEDVQKSIAEEMDKRQMVATSFRHDVQRLFGELETDQLATLRMIFHQLVGQEDGRLAAYFEGVAAATLHIQHNVCSGCGRDHDQEILGDHTGDPGSVHTPDSDEKQGNKFQEYLDKQNAELAQLRLFDVDRLVFSSEDLDNMAKYNIDDAYDEESRKFIGFVCTKGCGMRYPSIADRMLREPDDCSGCIQKAKWG